jgi:hypothetical protein
LHLPDRGQPETVRTVPLIAATALAAVGARQARDQAPFLRMLGSSIARPDAAGWVTDFLNATHHQRPEDHRDPADLRLALTILTTFWDQHGHRRLGALDALHFHRAFGRLRLQATDGAPRGTLDRTGLLAGAERLLGDWFADAEADPSRRGWGIAFRTVADRDAYDPTVRLRAAKVGPLTPPVLPPADQVWHTYAPVRAASTEGVVALLTRPELWPDFATELGRFTPLRQGGLAGQTFEIEIMTPFAPRFPAYTRGYVTITRLETVDDPPGLREWVDTLNEAMVRIGRDEPTVVPDGATPLAGFDLTTHQGHFMGSARNRLVLYEHEGAPWLRAAGTWDEMPFPLDRAYRRVGRDMQSRFWGEGDAATSMLHQIATQSREAA